MKLDRKRRAEKAAEEIGILLSGDAPDLQGAFDILKRWYRHATAHQPKPSREDLIRVTDSFRQLYTAQPPTAPPIPIHVQPFPVEDGLPTDDEIGAAIKRLRNGRAPGPSKMKAETLKDWHREAFPEDYDLEQEPDRTRWDLLTTLIHHMWNSGEIPTELTWTILVLIPKDNGDKRGIGLLEVI